MSKTVKNFGRVYTPDYLVNVILDFGNYNSVEILQKHVIDNSCGDGAFLKEIVLRYCQEFVKHHSNADILVLKEQLETYIHGIEIDTNESISCEKNLNTVVEKFGLANVNWDIVNADTLTINTFNNRMDFVFGNPPYVRVHNLNNSYDIVKTFNFAQYGMTDLFVVFFEVGFRMLSKNGVMCLITPSSWLSSNAGKTLRKYIMHHKNLSGIIDLEHFQPFSATTYTLISKFITSRKFSEIEYYTFEATTLNKKFQKKIDLEKMSIDDKFYLSSNDNLQLLTEIKRNNDKYVEVKNGFATLADSIFIGDFQFEKGIIDVVKASTGKWTKCIFPYDKNGKQIPLEEFKQNTEAFAHLLLNKEKLTNTRDIDSKNNWYLFGRTQAIKDVFRDKYAINTVLKDVNSIKLEKVKSGNGVYSGLYILTDIDFETIKKIIINENFIDYIKLLKNYKSGGYYTFSSKDLQQYLNYSLSKSDDKTIRRTQQTQLF